ncbi:peritrophin-48 [Stomoxys calcitrans]|uniref:peritrophin-48 n=1 Tax=Stomoxys calcitrans TaxID=35570 RepID=UPI0027E28980|nr:peritrophin-48 [Stomoxys calcitrans]
MKAIIQMCIFASLMAINQCLVVPHMMEEEAQKMQDVNTLCSGRFNGTTFANSQDCNKFYICLNNQAEVYNCADGYHFDKHSLTCVSGNDCDDDELTIPPTCSDGSKRAVNDDCFIFEMCVNGQYQKINCHPGFYFNAPKTTCKPIKYDADYKCNCVMPDYSIMTNRDNCETYYSCQGGKADLIQCPRGEYYNSSINSCTVDVYNICLMEPTKAPLIKQAPLMLLANVEVPKVKAVCGTQALGSNEISFHAHINDCSKFLVCTNGQAHEQQCPKKFYFDEAKQYCILDTEKKCIRGQTEASYKSPYHNKIFTRFLKY